MTSKSLGDLPQELYGDAQRDEEGQALRAYAAQRKPILKRIK